MSRHSLCYVTTVLVIALPILIAPVAASAQTNPSVPSGAESSPSTSPALAKSMSTKVEQHIKLLHDQLDITAAEEPQWAQFAQVMRDNATQMQQAFAVRGANIASMTAADNMESYAQLAQIHASNMQKLASAFQSLYNTFPDQQKTIADRIFRNNNGKPQTPKQ